MKLSKSIEGYEENGGWSSSLFYKPALTLMKDLQKQGHKIDVGRTVIHIADRFKCYVHHNGRSKEYATVTDMKGKELLTVHFTEFAKLEICLRDALNR